MVFAISEVQCPECSTTRSSHGPECPHCNPSLARYAACVKWFRVAFVGAILLLSGLTLAFLGSHYALVGWYGWLVRLLFVGGLAAIGTGMLGFIFSGAPSDLSDG